jgi:SET domain-containing protein
MLWLGDVAMKPRLIVRSSSIHAAGCYTLTPIRKGEKLCEYDGPRYPKAVADERYKGRNVTYLFSCGEEDIVIDGFGTAIHDIAAGEELTYEYNLHDSDDEQGDCYCGAEACRGTMFTEAEVKRRAKLKRQSSRELLP